MVRIAGNSMNGVPKATKTHHYSPAGAPYAPATKSRMRYLFYTGVTIGIFVLAGYMYNRAMPNADYKLYYTLLKSAPGGDQCNIPRPDPWDSSVQKYLDSPGPLVCKRVQPEATWLDTEGWIHKNETDIASFGYGALDCSYRCFDRKQGYDDKTLFHTDWVAFEDKAFVNCSDFVEASCSKKFPRIPVYTNLHNQAVFNSTRVQELRKVPLHGSLSPDVMLFVIDSVSRLNFIRHLPKTLKMLKEEFGATVFEGHVKVGDNSYPNAIAFMAGMRQCVAGYSSEMPEDMTKSYYDDWPFIWKDFAKNGYTTLYAEDYPNFSLFFYLSNGFLFNPTDHYFRPFWVALWPTFLHRRSTHLCYGNTPKHMVQMNYLKYFWQTYGKKSPDVPKFAINWITEISHDWMNDVEVADDDFVEYFRELKPLLNNTILFFMSDHGHRFDAIRESVIGRLEERMPFFSVSLPDWMKRDYPTLVENMKNNSQILTSPFDLYATMQDVVKLEDFKLVKDEEFSVRKNLTNRGSSLFRPLPPKRHCEDASIPEDFCICQREVMVNITDPNVQHAANELLLHINNLLKDYPTECARLTLKQIKNAHSFLPNAKVIMDPNMSVFFGGKNPTGFYINYRVTIQADPSDGLFEGMLRNSVLENKFTVIGDVNRINRYGNQSHCVHSSLLRKYCYCVMGT